MPRGATTSNISPTCALLSSKVILEAFHSLQHLWLLPSSLFFISLKCPFFPVYAAALSAYYPPARDQSKAENAATLS